MKSDLKWTGDECGSATTDPLRFSSEDIEPCLGFGDGSLDFGKTRVAFGACSSQGNIGFLCSSCFGFSGTSYHISFGGSG